MQDTATYKSKQQDISGQISVGTNGGNASGSFSKSNVDANYASVNEQSGIFAGDDGYQINVKTNTDLKGALITSTQKAENIKNNSLNTGTLTYSNIQNNSEYDAKGISLSAGLNTTKSDQGKPGTVISAPEKIDQHASTIQGVSKSIGFGLDSDKNSNVTQSVINTSNITIRETLRQEELTGNSAEQIKSEILTHVTTDTARENSGALQNNFDRDQVKSEINLQMDVTKKFDANRQEVRTEINKNLDEAKKAKEAGTLSQAEFDKKQQQLQTLGILVDSISAGLSVPTSSGLGIAAATVSPKLSYEIGQYFKANDSEGSAAHILAHTVLGAAVAAAGGNDALAAGISAGGAEASAPLLAKYLYGKESKDLTVDEKGTVSAITGLVASGVGASTGEVASTVQSGQVAQNAVENNGFSIIDENYGQVVKENTKEKFSCPTGYVCPIPEKTLGEKTLLVINDLTIRQLAAAMGAEYDPITKEHFTPKEIQEAKVAMLGLGFSKTLSGPIKLTDEAFENIGKKYGCDITKLLKEPEADFAGRIPVRPRDGYTEVGTNQIDTPLGKHLIDATINKKSKVISGGHNADNFYEILNANGGKVVGQPTEISKGITEVRYQLPNGRIEAKTVYDPKVYSNAQMASMANQAAAKAIVNYGASGKTQQNVVINGITFRVPVVTRSGVPQVPTSFPINPNSK